MPRLYLPIVFWIGLVIAPLALVFRDVTWAVAGVLLMAWGLLLGLLGLWANRRLRD
jgi:hypothetical protein